MKIWTPIELVEWTAGYLEEKQIDQPRLTAEILLSGILQMRRLDLYLQFDRPLEASELAAFKERLRRRVRHEPLQYIEGKASFRELELEVDPRVLIPRPETEGLVQLVLDFARTRDGLDVLDVGTGSGAIALSLRKEGNFRRVVATDVSEPALEVARTNSAALGLDVDFRSGPGLVPVGEERFDAIVSNPPYISPSEQNALDEEVVGWEPHVALFAEEDGLAVIRQLIAQAPSNLNSEGILVLELGADQGEKVAALVTRNPSFRDARILPDLAGRDRYLVARVENNQGARPHLVLDEEELNLV